MGKHRIWWRNRSYRNKHMLLLGSPTLPGNRLDKNKIWKGQCPRRVIFGPVKSLNMTRWKHATSYYICNIWLTTGPTVYWKKSYCLFSWFFNAPKSGKKHKNSKNCHFSPIFGDKFVKWNMKSQTRHKDILA